MSINQETRAVNETGNIPPGNAKGNTTWLQKKKAKAEIRLTPGKGIQDLTCSVQDLVDQVVKTNKVVLDLAAGSGIESSMLMDELPCLQYNLRSPPEAKDRLNAEKMPPHLFCSHHLVCTEPPMLPMMISV